MEFALEISFLDQNLLQLMKDSMKRPSIKRLRNMAGWDDNILSNILTQKFS